MRYNIMIKQKGLIMTITFSATGTTKEQVENALSKPYPRWKKCGIYLAGVATTPTMYGIWKAASLAIESAEKVIKEASADKKDYPLHERIIRYGSAHPAIAAGVALAAACAIFCPTKTARMIRGALTLGGTAVGYIATAGATVLQGVSGAATAIQRWVVRYPPVVGAFVFGAVAVGVTAYINPEFFPNVLEGVKSVFSRTDSSSASSEEQGGMGAFSEGTADTVRKLLMVNEPNHTHGV